MDDSVIQLLEDFVGDILPRDFSHISDMNQLITYWNSTSKGSKPAELIEARMAEVLLSVSDMSQLIAYWKRVFLSYNPAKLIETRIATLVEEITCNNVPEWYIRDIKISESLPEFYVNLLKNKARKLLS